MRSYVISLVKLGSNLKQRLIRSDFTQKVLETFATRIVLMAIGLVSSVIVPKILGPEGMGIYASALALSDLGVQFGNLGLYASNTYSISQDKKLLPSLLGNSLLVSCVIGFVISIAILILERYTSIVPVHGFLLVLTFVWIAFGIAYMLFLHLLLGFQEVRSYNKIELLTKVINVALILLLLLFGFVAVETVYILNLMILMLSCYWVWRRLGHYSDITPIFSLSLLRQNIHYSFKTYIGWFFTFIALRSDIFIVQFFLGYAETGRYAIAVAMANIVYMLPVAAGTILFPKLSAMTDDNQKLAFSLKTAKYLALTMLILAFFAGFLAGPFIRLVYGQPYAISYPAFLWLLPGIVMLSVNTIFMNYFASTGMPRIAIYSPFLGAIVNVLINVQMIPYLGIVGASISSTITYGIMLCCSLVIMRRKNNVMQGID